MINKNKKYAHGSFDVYLVCSSVHGAYNGSGDGLDDERLVEYHSMLKDRFDNWETYAWKERSQRGKDYDSAVKNLVKAALAEAEEMLAFRATVAIGG